MQGPSPAEQQGTGGGTGLSSLAARSTAALVPGCADVVVGSCRCPLWGHLCSLWSRSGRHLLWGLRDVNKLKDWGQGRNMESSPWRTGEGAGVTLSRSPRTCFMSCWGHRPWTHNDDSWPQLRDRFTWESSVPCDAGLVGRGIEEMDERGWGQNMACE